MNCSIYFVRGVYSYSPTEQLFEVVVITDESGVRSCSGNGLGSMRCEVENDEQAIRQILAPWGVEVTSIVER